MEQDPEYFPTRGVLRSSPVVSSYSSSKQAAEVAWSSIEHGGMLFGTFAMFSDEPAGNALRLWTQSHSIAMHSCTLILRLDFSYCRFAHSASPPAVPEQHPTHHLEPTDHSPKQITSSTHFRHMLCKK